MLKKCVFSCLLIFILIIPFSINAQQEPTSITRIATNLLNPRGVAFLPDGRLVVAEAGTGYSSGDPADYTGRISVFDDLNLDGDYDDEGERTPIVVQLSGYNILYQFNPGRDEIVGVSDVLVLDDGRIFFTLDDNFETLSIVELTPEFEVIGNLYVSGSTLNSIAYDAITQRIYVTESSNNTISAVTLDGESSFIASFNLLAQNQQAVPSGVAIDPLTGDLLVALFSGQIWDYYGSILSFMVGDAKVVRVNPETGEVRDEIIGLTTAVDVDVDEMGNIFVVELTTEWATPTMNTEFDLYDPEALPDAGGYARFTGRVTMYPANGGNAIILAEDLDAPTNITYHAGNLIISVGQGTPNRPIWVDGELQAIVGELYQISVPAFD